MERLHLWADLKKVAEAQDRQSEELKAENQSLEQREKVLDVIVAEVRRNLVELHKRELEALQNAHLSDMHKLQKESDEVRSRKAKKEASV